MAAIAVNTPNALCESDCHQIKEFGTSVFSKWEISTATRLDKVILRFAMILLMRKIFFKNLRRANAGV